MKNKRLWQGFKDCVDAREHLDGFQHDTVPAHTIAARGAGTF